MIVHRGAFTLTEVLAAVTIVAIATAALTVGLGAADSNARLRSLTADLIDLDARARLLAKTDRVCELRLPPETEPEVVLALVRQDGRFSTVQLPQGARVQATTLDDQPLEVIRFNRSGRTLDYRVTVTLEELTSEWTVAGLTGWVERQEAQP